MCPSYMATRDEEHSTRGRANALRAVLSGKVPRRRLRGQAALRGDGSLSRVQGLQGRVPVQRGHGEDEVRVPRTTTTRPTACPSATGIFGTYRARCRSGARAWRRSRTGSPRSAPNRWLMESVRGHRPPAPAARLRARDLHRLVRPAQARAAAAPRGSGRRSSTTRSSRYNTPEVGRAAVELLEAAGYAVELVDRKCCGRPLISKGMLDEAREHAALERRAARRRWVRAGVPIVGLEPSCLLTLRDEWVGAAAHRRRA